MLAMQDRAGQPPIDGFVYFTANMATRHPDRLREEVFWIPAYREEGASRLTRFVDDLGRKWGRYYAEVIGREIAASEISATEEGWRFLKGLRWLR